MVGESKNKAALLRRESPITRAWVVRRLAIRSVSSVTSPKPPPRPEVSNMRTDPFMVGAILCLLTVGCDYATPPPPAFPALATGSLARFSIELRSDVQLDGRRFCLVVTDPDKNIVGAFVISNNIVAASFPLPAGVTMQKANYVLCEGSRIVARGLCNQEGFSHLRAAILKDLAERPNEKPVDGAKR